MEWKSWLLIAALPSGILGSIALQHSSSKINLNNFSWKNEVAAGDTTLKDSVKYTIFNNLPLKPARKIAFDTKEGSWMSVDVNPDGTTIAFDMMGDI